MITLESFVNNSTFPLATEDAKQASWLFGQYQDSIAQYSTAKPVGESIDALHKAWKFYSKKCV